MPEVWFTLKKSLACTKSFLCDVQEPEAIGDSIAKGRTERDLSGCLRSKSNLRDIVCGSKRHSQRASLGSSSRSMASSKVLHSITHEIEAQMKTDNFSVSHEGKARLKPDSTSMELCTLSGPGYKTWISNSAIRNGHASSATSNSVNQFNDGSELICRECGGVFKNSDAVESHHLSKHAVKELVRGDSSRKVIELICQRNWSMSKSHHIEKVFRVRNSPKTLSLFEEHREMVKSKESKLEKTNPRCLVDGNELLRFYGTTLACSLATDGSQILCNLDRCGVCQILRNGFCQILRNGFAKKEGNHESGVFTCPTSGRAFESIAVNEEDGGLRRALMVCRVIAGRIYGGGVEEDEVNANSGFDSSVGKTGRNSKPEELLVFNPRAVLPCFVVTYKR